MNLSKRDKKLIWHPFSKEKSDEIFSVRSAKGSYIYDQEGKGYLDLISSWWVTLHGHSHPFIVKSIYEQSSQLDHVIFSGFTHVPAVELCEGIRKVLPDKLCRFFFSDNGSTSVEVALKIAYQYWFNKGKEERLVFLNFDGGYHGDTFGAMSVGKTSGYHDIFSKFFFKTLTIPYPSTWQNDMEIEEKEKNSLLVLRDYLEEFGDKIGALILEPLIQGASGMRICRPQFLSMLVSLVREYEILVIFDEVMTGFYRTGSFFALNQLSVVPDILCLSKGITGGFLPLGLTVTSEEIYDCFLDKGYTYTFSHGHSYTGNPIACAAALASLQLLHQRNTKESIKDINDAHRKGMSYLQKECSSVVRVRILGTISAFEIHHESFCSEFFKKACLQEELIIRPLGNTVYLLPPYSTSKEDLLLAYQKIGFLINKYYS